MADSINYDQIKLLSMYVLDDLKTSVTGVCNMYLKLKLAYKEQVSLANYHSNVKVYPVRFLASKLKITLCMMNTFLRKMKSVVC